jgi:hypothetical protein
LLARPRLRVLACLLIAGYVLGQESGTIRIAVLEGDGAINNVRVRTAREPRVRVEDQKGEPIAKLPVTFVAPSVGAGGTFGNSSSTMTVFTDEEGEAVATGFRPNGSTGRFEIRASASRGGETARAVITQTNAAPAQEARSRKILIFSLVAGAVAGGAIAAASGGGGKSSPAPTTPAPGAGLGLSPGDPSFGPPR